MSKYKWILFDIDNTLLDFSSASKKSLYQTFEDHKLHCDEPIYKIYKEENAKVWESFERKEIDTQTLRKIRFAAFFKRIGIHGLDPFVFNAAYLQNLIAVSELYDGVADLLSDFESDYIMSVITNGLKEVQRPRLDKVGITNRFDSIVVSDEIGIAKPDVRFFEHTYRSISHEIDKSEILVIGDNLQSDIQGGNHFGVDTCWISHNRVNKSEVKPTMTISSVIDLPTLI